MNADHLAVEIEKWTAGVAALDGAIGADGSVAVGEDAAQANDGSATLAKAAWVADGDTPLAVVKVRRIAHLCVRPVALLGDLDEAAVDGPVGAQGLAFHLP